VSLRPARILVAGACLMLFTRSPQVQATCGSANCFLVTGTQEGVGNRGQLIVDLSFRYVVQDRKLSGTRKVGEVLTPKVDFENGVLEPDHHREIRTQNTLVEIDMSYGLTDRLALEWQLPVINDRDHEHFGDVGTVDEHFSSADGSSGFGDIRAGVRYALAVKARQILVGGLAIKLPTGQYKLLDSEGEINEPTIEPGTGSTDFIGSLAYSRQIVPQKGEWFLSGSYRFNGENGLDYRFGDEIQTSTGFRYRTEHLVTWSLQVNGRRADRDEFLGDGVPSTGSTLVNLTPGLRLETRTGTSIYGFVQVPVYQKVNEVNLAPGSGIMIGVSHPF
jgi:hypothetical protein